MKKIILTIAAICTALSTGLNARSLMPSLDRIKKKVDSALESEQQSFKDLLAGAHNGVIAVDKNKSTSISLTSAEKELSDLYWANQSAFITDLSNTKKQSTDRAAQLLKSKIKEKYATAKIPLVSFAQDLAAEELCLQTFSTTLLRLSDFSATPEAEKSAARTRLQNLYQKHTQLKESLQQLIGIVNTLLIG